MRPAAKEADWLRQIRKEKGIQSTTLDEQPELFDDVKWIWNAFQYLSETRDYGFGGPLRIRPSDMQALMTLQGTTNQDDLSLFVRVVRLLDSAWLDDHYANQEAKKKQTDKRR